MKALVYVGSGRVEIRDVPPPDPTPETVLLRVRCCGVCGTDVGIYSGTHPRATAPLILGHEFVGEVAEDSSRFVEGQRVVAYPLISCGHCHPCRNGQPHVCARLRLMGIDCSGGMTEYLRVPEGALFAVPDELEDVTAALIEPLAVALRAVERSGAALGDCAVVLGAGPIGLLTAILLRRAGASRILVSDIDPARLALVERLGFTPIDVTYDDLEERAMKATEGDGADIVFECAGVPMTTRDMTRVARPGGTICLTSIHKEPTPVALIDINFRELSLVGSRVYTREQFRRAIGLAQEVDEDLRELVTHSIPLSKAESVFALQADRRAQAIKILIDCQS